MLKYFLIFTYLMLLSMSSIFAGETKLLHYPDIYGKDVVFSYAGDLWIANVDNGLAMRLTSHPGRENFPHFSPDGKWIAFTGEYDGNRDIYIIPRQGGEPQRLTYHGARDQAVGWTPDGKQVLFTSSRETGYYGPYLYTVNPEGGYPERVPVDRAAWGSYNADASQMAFNRRRGEFRNWKRYHGGEAQDVWIANLKTGDFQNITADYSGVDQRPLWIGDEIYFVSDRQTDILNLWAYNLKTKTFTVKTKFTDFGLYAPETDGKSVVFEHGGSLYLYTVSDGKYRELHITVPSENWATRPQYVNPAKHLGDFSLSPDGKWAVIDARGELFKISKKSGKWENLTHSQGVRECYPAISPDGKSIAYFSDKTGNYQLYVQEISPTAKPQQLTAKIKTTPYHPVWSPDSKKLIFSDKDYILRLVDVTGKKVNQIDRGKYQKDYEFFWEISEYDWSPDSKWIVYSKVQQNLNSALYLYSLKEGKSYQITHGELDDFAPVFDKGGDYIYFLSNRHFQPELDPSEDNYIVSKMTNLCAIQLRSGEKSPFEKEEEDDPVESKENESKAPFRIDLKNIADRVYIIPVTPGNFKMVLAGKNKAFVMGKERYGFPGIDEFFHPGSVQDYFIKAYDMEKQKETQLLDKVGKFQVNADGSGLIYRSGKTVGILKTNSLQKHNVGDGKLKLGKLEMRLDRHAEWRQIFMDIWRWYRDFFYDPNMHGVDWKKVRDQYLPLVKFVQTRNELNALVSEMVGEICASHMYIFGGESNSFFKNRSVSTGVLGADIVADRKTGLYRIARIFRGKSWDKSLRSPLAAPDIRVSEGDYLLEIDGHRLSTKENYLKYLINKAGKEVKIVLAGSPDGKDRREITIKPLRSDRNLRRWEWVKTRAELVKKYGGGDIGYMHLDDMDEEGLAQFEEGWKANKYKKGLIIDVRYNGGGFTNYFVIDKLERKLIFGVKTRDFSPMRFPLAVSNAKMATLINEFTGSDGELFTEHFKARKMGKVIGTRTWGGLIGIINVIETVDGGIAVQPNVGFYNFSGKWIVENHGAEADPGLAIDILPQQGLKGEDPQLMKAIELLKEEIGQNPPQFPAPPPFPPRKP